MSNAVYRFLLLVVLLFATAKPNLAQVDEAEASAVSVDEWEIGTPSLRQRRGQNERRLFHWGNLLCKYTKIGLL